MTKETRVGLLRETNDGYGGISGTGPYHVQHEYTNFKPCTQLSPPHLLSLATIYKLARLQPQNRQ